MVGWFAIRIALRVVQYSITSLGPPTAIVHHQHRTDELGQPDFEQLVGEDFISFAESIFGLDYPLVPAEEEYLILRALVSGSGFPRYVEVVDFDLGIHGGQPRR